MRADMDRVVIERPRWGSGLRNHDVRGQRAAWRSAVAHGDFDGEATRVPMVPRRGPTKVFSDLLGPLKRFLRRRCGRPWDEVYAEVRQRLRVDSLLQKHVLDHLADLVERRIVIGPDGGPWDTAYGWCVHVGLFVHPVTGRLSSTPDGWGRGWRRPPRAIRRAPQPMLQVYARLRIGDRLWLQLASGWVLVRLRDDDGHDALFDWPAAGILRAERVAVYGDANLRAATCRPVGRRARRARGLG
jgi:hypothetical protein